MHTFRLLDVVLIKLIYFLRIYRLIDSSQKKYENIH